ncbi:MAG TPA: hypothetical protein PKA13_19915 [Geminicoccaceae bacterium]|mgnify:CR=1 FL=1|nr:hypothetical protein [Geminicoccus sp.]HMU52054.1 hypothetical protein [Geminicoccaceae bacterium]
MIGAGLHRRIFALVISGIVVGYRPRLPSAQMTGMQVVHADEDWYRERPEREGEWRGELRPRHVPHGPAGRPALRYVLVTASGEIAVYDPTSSPLLTRLSGEKVIVRAKLVDLAAEGAGKELWVGEIGAAR